jgi:7,8-dihydro-6-hydroxymethylpterin-pyrophosphokinase
VLQPLADIRPELVLPGHSKCIAKLRDEHKSDEAPLVAIA